MALVGVQTPVFLVQLIVAGIGASLAVWTWVVFRLLQAQPVVRYDRRRRVPWRAIDVVIVAVFFLTFPVLLAGLGTKLFHLDPTPQRPGKLADSARDRDDATEDEGEEGDRAHLLVVLLRDARERKDAAGRLGILLLCVFSGVIVAPIVEEMVFRVILQGWMEAAENGARKHLRALRRLVPGAAPVVLTSLIFAVLHYREPTTPPGARYLTYMLAIDAVAKLVTLALAVGLVRGRVGATAADLGIRWERLGSDVGLGLLACLAVAAPIFAMQIVLSSLLPDSVPDPIPLFFFAASLGFLYYRTHRIVPSIVTHMALNATSLAMAWWIYG